MRRPHLPRNRFLRWFVLPAGVLVVCAVVAAAIIYERSRPHDVSHPDISFTQPVTATTPVAPKPKPKPKVNDFSWPLYGYTLARTRNFTAARPFLRPPLKVAWSHGGNALLEFSPSIHGDFLYYMDDGATVKKVDARSGHQLWQHHLGTLSAATPALDPKDRLLFVPTLSDSGRTPGNGRFAALSMKNGHVRWTIPLPSGSESSPLYHDGVVYFGTQAGTVYALNAHNGHVRWTFHAAGDVKGGPALSGGLLYFGDYAGKVYALHASSGKLAWEAGSGSGAFGFGSGTFYATPAVAFGRVYIGNTNGSIYSFAARTGQLAWERGTGAYVYSAAAVADTPGLGPTVYIGSYNGSFYALNAQSGAVRWVHTDGGRISGASTIVGNVVYYSDFNRRTTGLNVRTGRVVFSFDDGAYTPVIANPTAIYLDGNYVLYKLVPKRTPAHRHASSGASHRKTAQSRHPGR